MRRGVVKARKLRVRAVYLCLDVPRIQRRVRRQLLTEDVLAERVDGVLELVFGVGHRRYREDGVELLEREALGLRQEAEDEDGADDVPSRIPAERARRREGFEKARESEGDNLWMGEDE